VNWEQALWFAAGWALRDLWGVAVARRRRRRYLDALNQHILNEARRRRLASFDDMAD